MICDYLRIKIWLLFASATLVYASVNHHHDTSYGRISPDKFVLTQEQIDCFHREGCVTIPDVLTEAEVQEIEDVFDKFMNREIPVPLKDFCDMSKPFGIPMEEWSIVNCMLPTKYHPPFQNNIFERLTQDMAAQLFANTRKDKNHVNTDEDIMVKDYDQLLNKLPSKEDAVFAWHQDMGYWPGPKALGVDSTSTCTFSLAIDDSEEENGCLRYIAGSGKAKKLREHVPLAGDSREDGHALVLNVKDDEEVRLAPAKRGSVTIHDEYVVHGSSGNRSKDRQRRTYVLAYRPKNVVDAERKLGFTHSHNDDVNWDTFEDGEKHRVGLKDNDE